MLELTTYKNYKELVKVLGWEEKRSNSRVAQMKKLEAICKYHKEGRKYIIEEIYEEPKKLVDGRKNNGNNGHSTAQYFPNYLVSKEQNESIGIYSITLGNKIYIGSTTAGFRKRFLEHRGKQNPLPTREMLENGAVFEVLQICNGMTENEIRHIEDNWIEEYRSNPKWIVVNELKSVGIKGERKNSKPKPKYTKVRINKDDLDRTMELLKENGIDFKL